MLVSGVDGGNQRGVVVVDPGDERFEGGKCSFGLFWLCGREVNQLSIRRAWDSIGVFTRLAALGLFSLLLA